MKSIAIPPDMIPADGPTFPRLAWNPQSAHRAAVIWLQFDATRGTCVFAEEGATVAVGTYRTDLGPCLEEYTGRIVLEN